MLIVAKVVLSDPVWLPALRMLIVVVLKRWNGMRIIRSMLVGPLLACFSWLLGGCRGAAGSYLEA